MYLVISISFYRKQNNFCENWKKFFKLDRKNQSEIAETTIRSLEEILALEPVRGNLFLVLFIRPASAAFMWLCLYSRINHAILCYIQSRFYD